MIPIFEVGMSLDDFIGGSLLEERPKYDSHGCYAILRKHHPVARFDSFTLITRFGDVQAVLSDSETFSSERFHANALNLFFGRGLVGMDDPDHAKWRKIIERAFRHKILRGFRDDVYAIASEMIEGFRREQSVDLRTRFTYMFPLRVIARLIGIPIDDYDDFRMHAERILNFTRDVVEAKTSVSYMREYLGRIIEQRKSASFLGDDLVGLLLASEVDGEHLPKDDVISFLVLLIQAGAETTYNLLGSMVYHMLNEGIYQHVRSDRTLIENLTRETLRISPPVAYLPRVPTRDVVLHGVTIPEGTPVLCIIASANRDERTFFSPNTFSLYRTERNHMAFGWGAHFCLGTHLTHLEVDVAFNLLFDVFSDMMLDPEKHCHIVSGALRGPDQLPVLLST